MHKALALLCLIPWPALAETPQQTDAKAIEALSTAQSIAARSTGTLEGCTFTIREFASLEDGTPLLRQTTFDLEHIEITPPHPYANGMVPVATINEGQSRGTAFLLEGSNVLHLTGPRADDLPGRLGFTTETYRAILIDAREDQHGARRAVNRRSAFPSALGASYVQYARRSDRISMATANGAEQLRALETALLDYQETYCRP